jgi:hypothetical protein
MFTVANEESCRVYITAEPVKAGDERAGNALVVDGNDDASQQAIQELLKKRPDVITFEHEFATSERGVLLIERLMSDPVMAGAYVVVELGDGRLYYYTPGKAGPSVPSAPERVEEGSKNRRAPRVPIRKGLEIAVDGKPATLLDLSIIGAQVLSAAPIRPGRRVAVALSRGGPQLQVDGVAVWSRMEMLPDGKGVGYRAGIFFPEPDPVAILSFCGRHKA